MNDTLPNAEVPLAANAPASSPNLTHVPLDDVQNVEPISQAPIVPSDSQPVQEQSAIGTQATVPTFEPTQLQAAAPVFQPVSQTAEAPSFESTAQPSLTPSFEPIELPIAQPIQNEELPSVQPVETPVPEMPSQPVDIPSIEPVVQLVEATSHDVVVQQSEPPAQATDSQYEPSAQIPAPLEPEGSESQHIQPAPIAESPVASPEPTSAEAPLQAAPLNVQTLPDESDEDDDDDGYYEDEYAYMQNRELSWLTFNERVLDQGADESVPLLERLNFISIFWSNLQEFFMVRVGSLTDLALIEPPVKDSKTGMTPKEQINAIHERCRELYPIQESYYEHVRGSLAKQGVRHLRPDDLSEEQRNYLGGFMEYNIEPFLSPQIINPRHPFPHLENGKLYILLRLDDEADEGLKKKKKEKKAKKKEKGGAEGVVLGLIPLPHQCERVIKLPGRGFQFILLEHAIEMFAADIFSMYTIKHTNVICVTRNADIDANQTGDEQDEDYREHMKRLLKQRARLAPVRLECERPLSPVMENHMLKKLDLKRNQVYDTIVPLDLSFTWGLGSLLSDSKRAKLSNPPFTPAWPTVFDRKRRIIDQVTEKEVLLSYPYESMDPFVQLLKEAAFDPTVVSIKITLYRLASQSQLAEALITAAENGKEVTALFELRARFDEFNNIEWSQRFEQAGCNVIYGFRDYKVHSKICCITRRFADGSIQHITQLGTGNYNEKTAKLYTDLSFITTDEAFGRDATEFFRNMQLENVSDNYNVLCVAPLQIKPMILDNLDKQIALARQGKPCGAFLKANSITDKDVIEKIAEASQAGVNVTLFIRGICCLVPQVKGATDNVCVVSIVGRLLEHSRIYCFGTPDDCTMYLSSADLMTRNLNKRVEIAWPILNAEIRTRILNYIDICLHDTAKLRELRPNRTYTPLGAFCELDEDGNPQPAFDAQAALIERAQDAAAMQASIDELLQDDQTPDDNLAQPAAEPVVAKTDELPAIPAEPPEPAFAQASMPVEAAAPTIDVGASEPVDASAIDVTSAPAETVGAITPEISVPTAIPAEIETPAVSPAPLAEPETSAPAAVAAPVVETEACPPAEPEAFGAPKDETVALPSMQVPKLTDLPTTLEGDAAADIAAFSVPQSSEAPRVTAPPEVALGTPTTFDYANAPLQPRQIASEAPDTTLTDLTIGDILNPQNTSTAEQAYPAQPSSSVAAAPTSYPFQPEPQGAPEKAGLTAFPDQQKQEFPTQSQGDQPLRISFDQAQEDQPLRISFDFSQDDQPLQIALDQPFEAQPAQASLDQPSTQPGQSQALPGFAPQLATQAPQQAAQPATQAPQQTVQPGNPIPQGPNGRSFLDEGHRELEMPEKKPGLFSRFRKRK